MPCCTRTLGAVPDQRVRRFVDSGDPAGEIHAVRLDGVPAGDDRGEVRGPLPEVITFQGVPYFLSTFSHQERAAGRCTCTTSIEVLIEPPTGRCDPRSDNPACPHRRLGAELRRWPDRQSTEVHQAQSEQDDRDEGRGHADGVDLNPQPSLCSARAIRWRRRVRAASGGP